VVVGPLNKETIVKKLQFASEIPNKNVVVNKPTLAPDLQTSQIFGIQYADAEQSDIILAFRTLPYDYNGDFFKNTIMNFVLAGNFNSRLNLKIREEKAWTYQARTTSIRESKKGLPGPNKMGHP
jgi:zinc protease